MTKRRHSQSSWRRFALAPLGKDGRAQDLVMTNSPVCTAPDTTAQKNVTVLIRNGAIEDMMNNCLFDTLELSARYFKLAAEAA